MHQPRRLYRRQGPHGSTPATSKMAIATPKSDSPAMAPLAMRWAKWIMHVDASQLRPIDVIGRIAPRPIMLTHGTLDEIVPVRHAYTLFTAAEEPKELWVVPGAHHVGARDEDPDGYFRRVEHFFRQALSPAGALLPTA